MPLVMDREIMLGIGVPPAFVETRTLKHPPLGRSSESSAMSRQYLRSEEITGLPETCTITACGGGKKAGKILQQL